MTQDEMRAAIVKYHTPNAKEHPMVYSVWEDGEITLEKGGNLFGQRNCHMIDRGRADKAWPVALFPMTNSAHGRILAANEADAAAFRKLILT